LKIAIFNINGLRARLGQPLEWLKREAPDVACLQELKTPDERFPASDLERAGYSALWRGQAAWSGVTILARGDQPRAARRALPGFEANTHSRYLEAHVAGLLIESLYLPNDNPQPGPKFDYKLAWFDKLIEHAATMVNDSRPVVLAGDYNVVLTDEDIYNPRSWLKDALLQPQSRQRYAQLLAQGWTDARRVLHPDKRNYTFWDDFRQHWQTHSGLRIEHLLLNRALAPALTAAEVDTWGRGQAQASDHAPTWIELRWDRDADGGPAHPKRNTQAQRTNRRLGCARYWMNTRVSATSTPLQSRRCKQSSPRHDGDTPIMHCSSACRSTTRRGCTTTSASSWMAR
jgi:exodeoxyribonuclease III